MLYWYSRCITVTGNLTKRHRITNQLQTTKWWHIWGKKFTASESRKTKREWTLTYFICICFVRPARARLVTWSSASHPNSRVSCTKFVCNINIPVTSTTTTWGINLTRLCALIRGVGGVGGSRGGASFNIVCTSGGLGRLIQTSSHRCVLVFHYATTYWRGGGGTVGPAAGMSRSIRSWRKKYFVQC